MLVRFWGTRGSIPAPGPSTARYGGNTSCVELRTDDGTVLVLDCGTGARELGLSLARERPVRAHLLITHTHWDHIQGFPFFTPAFLPDSEITVYAPTGLALNLGHGLSGQMQYSYFPVKLEDLSSRLRLVGVEEGFFQIGNITVQTQHLNHTCPTIGYRITAGGSTVVYSTDHEPFTVPSDRMVHPGDHRHVAFLDRADLVIHDAQYDEAEYRSKLNWGHSPMTYAADAAVEAGVRRLALTHHDPTHDDGSVDRLVAASQARAVAYGSNLQIVAAAEGLEITLPERSGEVLPLPTPSALDRRPVAGARVLIVSDNPAHSGPIAEVLSEEGLDASIASNEGAARRLAHRLDPHAVILDGGALGQQVYRLAAALTAGSDARDMALILLAPSLEEDTIRRAAAAGFTDSLAIPFAAPMLYARLKAWLARYNRRDRPSALVRTGAQPPPSPPRPVAPSDPASARRAAILAATQPFSALAGEDLASLARGARHRTFAPGQVIVEQGHVGGTLYVIVSGRVQVVGRAPQTQAGELLLDELGGGDIFGEFSSLDELPHSATVRAMTRTRCLAIQRGALLAVIERSPALNLELLRTLTHRLRQADDLLTQSAPDALTGF